jgi:hypothetical protein
MQSTSLGFDLRLFARRIDMPISHRWFSRISLNTAVANGAGNEVTPAMITGDSVEMNTAENITAPTEYVHGARSSPTKYGSSRQKNSSSQRTGDAGP